MRKRISALAPVFAFLALASIFSASQPLADSGGGAGASPIEAPRTQVHEVKDLLHGVEIIDPYRWLEDQNSPETRSWIDAQNAYTESLLSKVAGREKIKQRLNSLLKIDAMGSPSVRNGRYFFFRRLADQDQGSICMRNGLQGKDEVLIDPLPLSSDHTISLAFDAISRDGTLLAYSIRQGGEDEVTPHLFDVETRKDLADQPPKARYSGISILPDKSGVYYSKVTPDGPRVFFHKIGGSSAQDAEIFGKGYGAEKIIGAGVSEDGHYLILTVLYGAASKKTEVYVQDLAGKGPIIPIVNDVDAAFFGQIAGDKMYLRTNWKAPKGRVLEVDLKNPARERWREVVPESDGVLEGVSAVGGKLALRITKNVVSTVRLLEPSGKLIRGITPPTIGTVSGLGGLWSSNEAFFSFTSIHVPLTIYRYDIATGKQQVWTRSK